MKRLTTGAAALVAAVVLGAGQVSASPIYGTSAMGELTGSRSTTSGLVGVGYWELGFSVSWSVSPETNNLGGGYRYAYAFTTNAPWVPIESLVLELSDGCANPSAGCLLDVDPDSIDQAWGTFSVEGWNAPVGYNIYGVKFQPSPGETGQLASFNFWSPRVPVYGDIYGNGSQSYVYNAGLTNHAGSESVTDFIVRPDTEVAGDMQLFGMNLAGDGDGEEQIPAVPEPASLLLLGTGLLGLGRAFRKRGR